ncbi:unnamed protein product [Miscanthus lutarioriparius]|uniref:Cupin type-1 domain-containing protein n=1 Tax=Miscanthus lutarioriparius TaxID=422564 RepID=A0A811R6N5_9POAL|nr:unnamed protein product [Miscanthus lutarioriparius]
MAAPTTTGPPPTCPCSALPPLAPPSSASPPEALSCPATQTLPRSPTSSKASKGTCGVVLPEATKEKVTPVKEGDSLALPFGVVTWWHNAHAASSDLVDAAAELVSTQPGADIVIVKDGHRMPEARDEDREGLVLNFLEAPLDVDIKNGGRVVVLNTRNLPLVKEVGLSADLVRIDAHSMCSPGFSCGSAYQVTYIVRASGRIQIVGINVTRVLETRAEGGCLFIVPRFFVVSKIADETGMEWFSIITTPK